MLQAMDPPPPSWGRTVTHLPWFSSPQASAAVGFLSTAFLRAERLRANAQPSGGNK